MPRARKKPADPPMGGQCGLPRYGEPKEARRPWQHGADRCVEWKRIGTALVKRAGVV